MIVRKLIQRRVINNGWINPIWRFFNLDAWLNNLSQQYIDYKPDESLSLQEIAGYSNKPEINATLALIHTKLGDTISPMIKDNRFNLLDIGCGPGLFLKDFEGKCKLTGIDISEAMVRIAKKQLSNAQIIHSHFLKYNFLEKFDAIYSIGVLIYFNHGQIKAFFSKIYNLLNANGVVFVSYPHAYRPADLQYPDFTYVNYTSEFLESIVSKNFEVVYHKHVDGTRKVIGYDNKAIPNSQGFEGRTYQNSSILILKKK